MARTTHARAGLANAIRHHPDDHEAIAVARRDLTEAKLEKAIAEAVATWPPLTAGQRDRLALLLNPGGGDAA